MFFTPGQFYNSPVPDDAAASIAELRKKFEVRKCQHDMIDNITHISGINTGPPNISRADANGKVQNGN